MSPLSNAYLSPKQLNQMEPFYPLCVRVCAKCFLVQLEELEHPEKIFGDYAYFSSYSESWLRHARDYCARMIDRFNLGENSMVVEVASNDGYLLQYFQRRGVRVLGIEPARNVALEARRKGIPTVEKFFGIQSARELSAAGQQADLIVANNVLAHVPNLRDFVAGLNLALKPHGTITLEFPHLLRLIEGNQFDTIYHEHFSYFSFLTAEEILREHGLSVSDVEILSTHGGSLRVFAGHAENDRTQSAGHLPSVSQRVLQLRQEEHAAGIQNLDTYSGFGEQVRETKRALLELLSAIKRSGKSLVAYGAPAKGNTLLNYCGIGRDFLDYAVDLSPHKQSRFLPGTHLPIYHPDRIRETRPDYVLVLPWNLRQEILAQISYVREWGGRFVIPIPKAEILD